MRDTASARDAIRDACGNHAEIKRALSTAILKLEAAAGFHRDARYPSSHDEDDPFWVEQAQDALSAARSACAQLDAAISDAQEETAKLLEGES